MLAEIALLKTQSGRAREIIRNLSRFSSQQPGPPSLVDLRLVIAEVIALRRHDLEKSSITLDVDASASGRVSANVTELEQVALNFVINAQQAIESAGRGKGTGLGLSVGYGIVDSYGGVMGYRGNEWHGATFFFELPAAGVPPGEPVAGERASIAF